ncbi:hypothetical protein UY3_09439 [Chelonia mydas]|uniref:Uncharacterized protein n=1 Tax=Chelonia mydas TaxID=8469 RepID=M7BD05_CHEMY|nr:hypothetical protein UY3_09439 [Chelonia mydas]
MEALKLKPDQGKAFELTSKWDASNHFLTGGGFTRFADWRFIHRARLNCVPFNGAVRHGNRDKRPKQLVPWLLILVPVDVDCTSLSSSREPRQALQEVRLIPRDPAPPPVQLQAAVNCAIPVLDSQLRPDVVVTDEAQKKIILVDITVSFENRTPAFREARAFTDEAQKKIILVDITVSFENRTPAFREARACKLEKYGPLADTLRAKGYEVQMDALIVGALGAWDPCNERVLWTCGIGRCYAQLMWRLMVSDTIRWSRDICTEHITGH